MLCLNLYILNQHSLLDRSDHNRLAHVTMLDQQETRPLMRLPPDAQLSQDLFTSSYD